MPQRHAGTLVASVLITFCVPMAIIVYLDTECLRRWLMFWGECSKSKAHQFKVGYFPFAFREHFTEVLNLSAPSVTICLRLQLQLSDR